MVTCPSQIPPPPQSHSKFSSVEFIRKALPRRDLSITSVITLIAPLALSGLSSYAQVAAPAPITSNLGAHPNLVLGRRPLRYHPDNGDSG